MQLRATTGHARPVRLSEDPVVIGRHPSCTIRSADDQLSRRHCVIEQNGSGWVLRDLESRNGTKLNGMRIDESPLGVGDLVKVGGLEFRVEEIPEEGEVGGANEPWFEDLRSMVEDLRIDQSAPILINASGKGTEALRKAAHGPQALGFLFLIAMATRATDIHIEPKKESHQVRMRVDGRMVWVCDLPRKVGELVGGMVKAACEMGQAARDAIQEGHCSARFEDRRVEFRISFTPSLNGQKLVIRVLDQMSAPSSLGELGLLEYMQRPVQRVCRQDHGLLLVSGPTGSGKTTTLYNCLREIDRESRNVITIEDPVEYQIDGVTQMPVNEGRGNSFGSMLRSVLRQDPDVILLGEVRDEDTARTAMQAAMTGHVVFSTIHAKDTITSVFRLLDLKVEPYLVANSLDVVLAQRLVRVVCPMCVREVRVTPGQSSRCGRFLQGKDEVPVAVGCRSCLRTGYQGRRAAFEMLEMNDELRDVILTDPSIQAMKRIIAQGLFTTLEQFGWRLVADGVTTLEEVERVAGS